MLWIETVAAKIDDSSSTLATSTIQRPTEPCNAVANMLTGSVMASATPLSMPK